MNGSRLLQVLTLLGLYVTTTLAFTGPGATPAWRRISPAEEDREPNPPPSAPKGVLSQKAETGDKQAQFELGIAYELGRGVTKSHEEAAKWWHKAAHQGLAQAQTWLGYA
jgi:TPR repeat protein